MKSKLILFEGIPGSGKTTAALNAQEWLTRAGLPPALYLEGDLDHRPRDVRGTLERVAAERPVAWREFVTAYLTQQAYGRARGLAGYEGVIAFYELRQTLELELLPRLGVTTLWVDPSDGDWARCHAEIAAFLKLHTQVESLP